MKWIQFLMILLLGFPLFQMDEIFDVDWLICENALSIKSEEGAPHANKCLWYALDPIPSLYDRVSFFLQLKDPLCGLYSSFQRATSFCRPPPRI